MHHLFWTSGHDLLVDDIVRAENCYVYDRNGLRYVDLESGVWCTSIGHCHPRVVAAIRDQAGLIVHSGFNYSARVVEETAREVLSLLGFTEGRCAFLCSGSEAVEYGVRIARSLVGSKLLLTMHDSYYGAYGSAFAKSSEEWLSFDWSRCANCPDDCRCDASCERWSSIAFDRVGGFVCEPGSSSGLVRFPPWKLIRAIGSQVRRNGGLVLVNEVTTGTGRTGRWFGFQHYDLEPDIVALGKGIGNGYPVSVVACKSELLARGNLKGIRYGQSHQNDPLGARVIREVIAVIQEERLVERSRFLGDLLLQGVEFIRGRIPRIREVRGRGLMVAFDLDEDPSGSLAERVHKTLIARGYLIGKRPDRSVFRIDPSLTVEQGDLEDFLSVLEATLREYG